MKPKTLRTLQIIALALFVFAFLLSIVSIFLQDTIKSSFYGYKEGDPVFQARTAPYGSIIGCFAHTLLALIWLLLLIKGLSRGGSIAAVIVLSILLILYQTAISPVAGIFITRSVNVRGIDALASYNAVSSFTSKLTMPFSTTGNLLMLLSLGGACGRDTRSCEQN